MYLNLGRVWQYLTNNIGLNLFKLFHQTTNSQETSSYNPTWNPIERIVKNHMWNRIIKINTSSLFRIKIHSKDILNSSLPSRPIQSAIKQSVFISSNAFLSFTMSFKNILVRFTKCYLKNQKSCSRFNGYCQRKRPIWYDERFNLHSTNILSRSWV